MSAVVFDFDGSLALARMLWTMADELDGLLVTRSSLAETALTDWIGNYANEFSGRIDHEQQAGSMLARQLRAEAGGWAEEWRKAMDQENWNRYAAAVDRVEADRGVLDSIGGFLFGHSDLPPQPSPAAVPVGPGFAATRSFANYSGY